MQRYRWKVRKGHDYVEYYDDLVYDNDSLSSLIEWRGELYMVFQEMTSARDILTTPAFAFHVCKCVSRWKELGEGWKLRWWNDLFAQWPTQVLFCLRLSSFLEFEFERQLHLLQTTEDFASRYPCLLPRRWKTWAGPKFFFSSNPIHVVYT